MKTLWDHVRYCHLIYCLDKIFTFKPFSVFHIFECKHKYVTGISFLVAYDLSQLSYTSSDVPGWISHFCDIPLLHMRYCSYSLLWSLSRTPCWTKDPILRFGGLVWPIATLPVTSWGMALISGPCYVSLRKPFET